MWNTSRKPDATRRIVLLSTIAALVSASGCRDGIVSAEARRRVESTGPALAVAWNQLAYEIAYGEDQFLTFKGQRAIAMMHLAMHDALQAVVPLYESYVYDKRRPDADPMVAAAYAAREILVAAYPDRRDAINAELAKWRASVPEGAAQENAREVGVASAHALLQARENDGWNAPGSYTFGEAPG